MKKRTTSLLLLVAGLVALAFTAAPITEYSVDARQSTVKWIGRKVTGSHDGAINISSGKLLLDGRKLTGGSFEIDMASMTNTDITDKESNGKLVGHLKSDDFFATDKHPKATFKITKVTPQEANQYLIKGDLTIKGTTKEVEFPATVQTAGKQVKASAKILVDRTHYDIKYGSGSFFDDLGDKAIDNEFELKVALVANQSGTVQ